MTELPGKEQAKAVTKLAEVAEMLLKPPVTVVQTWADSYRAKELAKSDIECAELKQRARQRAELTEIRHQQNLEATLERTRLELNVRQPKGLLPDITSDSTSDSVTVEASDPDWFHRWAGFAKECSDEEIRSLWAKVLAGEIIKPGRFSLRLLHAVSLLRKNEAQKFQKAANYLWSDSDGRIFYCGVGHIQAWLFQRGGFNSDTLKSLEHLGLMEAQSMSGPPPYLRGGVDFKGKSVISYAGRKFSLKCLPHTTGPMRKEYVSFDARLLTGLGAELYELCNVEADKEYPAQFFQILSKDGSGWEVVEERN